MVDTVCAYTYLLKFVVNGVPRYYYGVRYGNVKLGRTPTQDLFKEYFTSSKSVGNLLAMGVFPVEATVHRTFARSKDACEFEVAFLTRVNAAKRTDFINQVNRFDNSLPCNAGRVMSAQARINIGIASKFNQSSAEYRQRKSDAMKAKWSDPEFNEYMRKLNDTYWNSAEGRAHKSPGMSGLSHDAGTRALMSESAKAACKKIDCKARALKRKRYRCPECGKGELDGGNFNSHMIGRHWWVKESCVAFKASA